MIHAKTKTIHRECNMAIKKIFGNFLKDTTTEECLPGLGLEGL